MSIKVFLEVDAKPECIDELKNTLVAILPDTRAYDGCIGVEVKGNQDNALNLVLIESWETRAKYETYLAWRTETGAVDALVAMLSGPPSIRYYDNLAI